MGGLEPAIQRLARSRPDAVTDRDVAALGIATQGEGLFCLGRHDLAEPELDRALAIAAAGHRDYLGLRCRTHLAAVSLARSDYAQTRRRANEAVRFAAEHGFARHPASAYPYALAGWAAYQSLDTDMAQRCATLSAALLPRRAEPSVELLVRSLGAVLASTHGEGPYDALVTLRGHWTRRGQDAAVHPSLVALSSTAEVRMALRLGELAWAGEAVRRARDQLDDSGDALLSRAMVLAHRGCTAAARAALEKITHGEVASHLAASVVEANLLFAVLAAHGREHNAAHAAVLAALDIAAGTRALRPFLDGRDSVRRLLVASVGRFGRLDGFVEDVLTRIPVEPNAMVGALTPREHELLAELPSMRTTDEIAEGLYLSVNTVKTHLRSVYRKLGVSSRREAILAARTLGLL